MTRTFKELVSIFDNFTCFEDFVVDESLVPISNTRIQFKKTENKDDNHWYEVKQVLMGVVLYWLMIEENSMEKNSDEREAMLDYYHLRKNKSRDQLLVEIVGKMHDEENQHPVRIMLAMSPNQTIKKYTEYMINLGNLIYWFCYRI